MKHLRKRRHDVTSAATAFVFGPFKDGDWLVLC